MRARRGATQSEIRLFKDEREIGYIRGTTVGFHCFATPAEAAQAASASHRGLAQRRGGRAQSPGLLQDFLVMERGYTQYVVAQAGVLAKLCPPEPEGLRASGWGFEIQLLPEDGPDFFAVARARVMWHELRSILAHRSMQQFGAESSALAELSAGPKAQAPLI